MSFSSSPASTVSGSAPPHVVEDHLGIVQLLSDGTVTRPSDYSRVPPPAHARYDLPVQWKDVVYDDALGLRLRMYRPTAVGDGGKKLPVIVYFHGGGFCIASFELHIFHAGGLRLAHDLPAIVLSADYRLAPEHRLPAAHDDAEAVFLWLRSQAVSAAGADPWLAESADYERVFVCGDSAGGNISHHIAVRHGSGGLGLEPVRIAGAILLWPYFGGEKRTVSEATCPDTELILNLPMSDQLWRLALPVGATRDHPAANPFGPESVLLDTVAFPPMLVADPDQDMLHDRIVDYVARLKAMRKPVEVVEFKGQGHAFFAFDPWGEASDELIRLMKRFLYGGAPPT